MGELHGLLSAQRTVAVCGLGSERGSLRAGERRRGGGSEEGSRTVQDSAALHACPRSPRPL